MPGGLLPLAVAQNLMKPKATPQMRINAENEAAKAASIPASPGPSLDPSQDECVACEADEPEAGPSLLAPGSALNRMAIGLRFISGTPNSSRALPIQVLAGPGSPGAGRVDPPPRFLRIGGGS